MKNKKGFGFLILLIAIVALFAVSQIIYSDVYKKSAVQSTHEKVENYINSELSYEPGSYDQYIYDLQQLASLPHISNSDKGHVYERMAQIYNFKGDTLDFYHTMGNALYYLDKSGNADIAVNIYEDIANYYLSDCNYEQAKNMIEKAYGISPIEGIKDPQVKSYAYRMQAIISAHEGKLEEAHEMIDNAIAVTSGEPDALWYGSYVAINEAALAGIAFEEQDYDLARELIDRNRDSEYFTTTIFADIITRDFIIPYYDTAVRLAALDGDVEETDRILKEYKSRCEQYNFLKKELNTISSLLSGQYALPESNRVKLRERRLELYTQIIEQQSDDYASMINAPLENGIKEQEHIDIDSQARIRQRKFRVGELLVALVVLYVIGLIIHHSLIDPLTEVGNRRMLNYYLHFGFLGNGNKSVIMMDLDNFKRVNDTYGHDKGDEVLKRLGSLLKSMQNRRLRAFRFGGEEFVVIMNNPDLNAALRVAENIRRDVKWQKWDFMDGITLSLGVSNGRLSQALITEADANLYFSKENGKNAVTYLHNGIKTKL